MTITDGVRHGTGPTTQMKMALDLALVGQSWTTQGLCGTEGDPDWWHGETDHLDIADGISTTNLVEQAAKEVCSRCPVQPACLAYGLAHPALDGVYGGQNQAERGRMRQAERRRAP